MRGEKVTFRTPVFMKGGRVIGGEIISGVEIAFGLVAHPALVSAGEKFGFWDVSCPDTGCLIATGDFPGKIAASSRLIQLVRTRAGTASAFRRMLDNGRKLVRNDPAVYRLGGRVQVDADHCATCDRWKRQS